MQKYAHLNRDVKMGPFIYQSRKNGSVIYSFLGKKGGLSAKSDGFAHPMNLHTQYHKTVSWNCKRSVALLQTHEENILPYTVKIDSARAVSTLSRNFRFFAIRKSLKMPECNLSSIHGRALVKLCIPIRNAMTISNITLESCLVISNIFNTLIDLQCSSPSDIIRI